MSDHLVLLENDPRVYIEFGQPVAIAATNRGKICTYGTGYLRVAMSASGIEQEEDLEDVYYAMPVVAAVSVDDYTHAVLYNAVAPQVGGSQGVRGVQGSSR